MSKLINAIQAGNQPYQAACTGITHFVSMVEGESLPDIGGGGGYAGFAAAQTLFISIKTDAMHWVNELFPDSTTLPQAFVNEDTPISGQLNALISACAQLSQQGVDQSQLLGIIEKGAAQLIPTVQSLQTLSANLAQSLQACLTVMAADQGNCQAVGSALQQQLSALAGELDHARNATSPSRSTIERLSSEIASCQQQLSEVGQLSGFFGNLVGPMADMVNGLNFLTAFWNGIVTNGRTVQAILTKASSDAAMLVKIDLQTTLQQWQGLVTYMRDTAGS
jgi:hypothetical protein